MDQAEDQYSCLEEFFLDSCRYGDFEDVIECFPDNVDVSWVDNNLNNCVHMASANGHLNIIMEIKKFVDQNNTKFDWKQIVNQKNADGNTPLHWGVINRQEAVIKYLLENGSDANIKNSFNRTALDEAIDFNEDQLIVA